jgi:prevent-host-death family protein
MNISANELKTKGVSIIESNLAQASELIITVRGKERFVVMDMKHYNNLRECELEAALHQARAEVKAGHYIKESVDDHIKRVTSNDL